MLPIYGFVIILTLQSIKSVYYRDSEMSSSVRQTLSLVGILKGKTIDWLLLLFLVYRGVDKDKVAEANDKLRRTVKHSHSIK